jgi:hypothetical protein
VIKTAKQAAMISDLNDMVLRYAHRAESAAPSRPDAGGGVREGEAALLKAMEQACWTLRCVDIPTGGGDADVAWEVIQHHEAKPHERMVSHGKTPTEALQNAIEPKCPNCNDANEYGDYEGPTCEVCGGIGRALSTPPVAAESNASVEARLREALAELTCRSQAARDYIGSCSTLDEDGNDRFIKIVGIVEPLERAINNAEEAISAVGDEAKKSEGGVDWDDVRGIAPNATGDLSSEAFIREQRDSWDDQPSAPTAERREIVTRALRSLKEITPKGFANYHNLIDEALSGLAALDGGR